MRPATAAIAAACLLVTAACSGAPEATAPSPPLTHEADGITFAYPSGWSLLTDITAIQGIFTPDAVVGSLDAAGNLIGFAVRTQRIDPPVPDGEEHGYLVAAFSRYGEEIWGDGIMRGGAWDFIDGGVDGRDALRAVIDHTARAEPLTTTVLAAVDGPTMVIIQCQAPTAVFDLLEPRCSTVVDSLRIEWSDGGSTGVDGT